MSPVYFVTQVLSTLRGAAPIARRQGVSPIFRAALVQTGLWPPPLRSGGETPPRAPCYPRLRQVAFGMYMPRFNADVQRPNPRSEDTMSSVTTPNNLATIDSKKPSTKQELIAANIKLLIEQLEAGHSDALTNC